MNVFTFCLLTTLFYFAVSMEDDYYWRDYRKAIIPYDAFPAGKDEKGMDTYIGQVYLNNYAMAIGQIFTGKQEVEVPMYGVRRSSRLIKILCTKQLNKLTWIPTTAATFHADVSGMHPVIGGADEHEPNKGEIHVGRFTFQGAFKIGAIASFEPERPFLYFVHDNAERNVASYQALIYNNSVVDTFDGCSNYALDA